MNHKILAAMLISVVLWSALSGCAYMDRRPQRPAMIGHIVFVGLNDSTDYDEILGDSESMLSSIPGVVSFAAGRHIDTGRASVIRDYDLAIYIGFDTIEDLAEYVESQSHIAFVTKWKPRLSALRVYDMHDPTP